MSDLRRSSIDNVVNNAKLDEAQYIVKKLYQKYGEKLNNTCETAYVTEPTGKCTIRISSGNCTPLAFSNYFRSGGISVALLEMWLAEKPWSKANLYSFFTHIDDMAARNGIRCETYFKRCKEQLVVASVSDYRAVLTFKMFADENPVYITVNRG